MTEIPIAGGHVARAGDTVYCLVYDVHYEKPPCVRPLVVRGAGCMRNCYFETDPLLANAPKMWVHCTDGAHDGLYHQTHLFATPEAALAGRVSEVEKELGVVRRRAFLLTDYLARCRTLSEDLSRNPAP